MAFAAHASKDLVLTPGPHTPSGSIPPYAKGPTGRRRHKDSGAREGHGGLRREVPVPDRVETIEERKLCPECDGPALAAQPTRHRKRIIKDIL